MDAPTTAPIKDLKKGGKKRKRKKGKSIIYHLAFVDEVVFDMDAPATAPVKDTIKKEKKQEKRKKEKVSFIISST